MILNFMHAPRIANYIRIDSRGTFSSVALALASFLVTIKGSPSPKRPNLCRSTVFCSPGKIATAENRKQIHIVPRFKMLASCFLILANNLAEQRHMNNAVYC